MTTTRAALLELADRCEQASGPDRTLDAEIHCAIRGYTMHEDSDPERGIFAFWIGEPWNSVCSNCTDWSALTASLDAALSLVPKGWGGKFWWSRGLKHPGVSLERSYPTNREVFAEGKTAPTTMCAAALRALAAEAGHD